MNKKFLKIVKKHFNEPVLTDFGIARLVGYHEDEDDCYYVLQYPYGPRHGLVYHTFVGGVYFLNRLKKQGVITSSNGETWSDFTRLDNSLELNGAKKVKKLILKD